MPFNKLFHVISDLHLEHRCKISSLTQFANQYKQLGRKGYDVNDSQNKNRILILAGDIGYPSRSNYWMFLRDCAQKYQFVICVPGNHEYYDEKYSFDQTNKLIECESKKIFDEFGNFHYLNNSSVTIDGVKYIGTTLWSQLDPLCKKDITSQLNDFNYITLNNNCDKLTFEQYVQMHQTCLNWLQQEIDQTINTEMNQNFVVITHHLPSYQLIHPKYKFASINSAFYTNLDDIIKGKLWVAGHTHQPMTKIINNTLIVVNPFGYANECLYASINETNIEFK